MKKAMYRMILLLSVIAGITWSQTRIVNVAPDVIDGLYLTIKSDSAARMQALPTQTIYMLKRNGYYPIISVIENTNYFLYIKAESGTGWRPLLVPSKSATNTYPYKINFRASGRLEGLTLEMAQPGTGAVQNRAISVYSGASLWVKDCEIVHDRGGAISLLSDSCSLYIDDSYIHSIGHPKSVQGNGRVVDIRPTNYQDSIVVRNSTFYNLTDRIMRNVGTRVNYVKFDHNTCLITEGYHGGLQLGATREFVITNNIFMNPIAWGSFYRRTKKIAPNISEQTQPENTLMYVLTLDTSYLVPQQKGIVRNNNVWWEQQYKDMWVKYKDSTEAPGIVTTTIKKLLGADSTKAFFTEPLTFKAGPPSIYNFMDSSMQFPNSLTLPENWYWQYQDSLVGGYDGPINVSYGTSAPSYTKGDGGFPIGDLNWYPTKKSAWLLTNVSQQEVGIPAEFVLRQNYPNPFNPSTSIAFSMNKTAEVSLAVYDILGREVSMLLNEVKEAGTHQVTWNATGMASGVYFYKLQSGNYSAMKKMALIK